jgi:hypothetical protein
LELNQEKRDDILLSLLSNSNETKTNVNDLKIQILEIKMSQKYCHYHDKSHELDEVVHIVNEYKKSKDETKKSFKDKFISSSFDLFKMGLVALVKFLITKYLHP